MDEITIQENGQTLSRVYFGRDVAGVLPHLAAFRNVLLVCDEEVLPYANALVDASAGQPGGGNCRLLCSVRTSEAGKNMDTVLGICCRLLEADADRDALLLAIGGGITTDMAGFAASIYKRGIRFAFLPTTLLAQVDAAIGGKTGINFLEYKNMIGVIRQPVFTWTCTEVLRTLPRRDFVAGSAELLKTFLIDNATDSYADAVSLLARIRQEGLQPVHEPQLLRLIAQAAAVKAGIVGRDQFEHGERRLLNLGHTFAHAIESLALHRHADICHGEAVAMGILLAARLSEALSLAEPGLSERLAEDWKTCGLPVDIPFPITEMRSVMTKDKKAEGGKVHFILIRKIGAVCSRELEVSQAADLLANNNAI